MKKSFKKWTYLTRMGFALVEIILATAILSGGLLMIVRLFPFGLKIEEKIERDSTASLLGQTLLEEMKRSGYDDLNNAYPQLATGQGSRDGKFEKYQGYSYQVKWWDTETPSLRKVRVRILYEEPAVEDKKSPQQCLELVTYLARHN